MANKKIIDISDWAEDFPECTDLTVEVKRMSFGAFTRMQDEMAQVKFVGNQQIVTTNIGRGRILTLLNSIVKAPFPITEVGINEIPFDLGDMIFFEIENMTEIEKN